MSTAPVGETAPRPTGFRGLAIYDFCFELLCQSSAVLIVLVAAFLVAILVDRSMLSIRTVGFDFLFSTDWNPQTDARHFGALSFIWGTLATSAIAMLIAVPLGVGTAAYLSEIAGPTLRRIASFFIEMLAAIPSVIYGFWGIFVLAPILQWVFTALGGPNTGGRGLLAAGVVLAVMIVPYIAAISYDVCQAVPRTQREGSLALGATRWQTIWGVVLPYARPGIIAGAFLALGRALGETMAVTMLIGNERGVVNLSPFGKGDSIASVLANQYMEADYDLLRSVLVELALVLMLVTVTINTVARVMLRRIGKRKPLLGSAWNWFRPRKPQGQAATPTEAEAAPQAAEIPARVRLVVPPTWPPAKLVDRVMTFALGGCVAFTMSMLILILGYLLFQGVGALNWSFFTELPVSPAVRRGTQAEVALKAPRTLPQLQKLLHAEPKLPDEEVGPASWVGDTALAEKNGRPLPTRDRFEVYSSVLDGDRVAASIEGRLGDAVALVEPKSDSGGGLSNAIVGTLTIVGLATLFAVPVGLLSAIYLSEYRAGPLARVVRFISEQLGGVPSIVIGIFAAGLFQIVSDATERYAGERIRFHGWAGVFALAVMMIPIVIRAAEEALKLVPVSLRTASFALGASHAQTILKVVVPAALPAIITAIFLSIARIAGETAPLLLTAGFNRFWPESLNEFTPTLPPYIYKYATGPSENWNRQAWAAAFLLMVLVLLMNFGIRFVAGKRVVQASRAD